MIFTPILYRSFNRKSTFTSQKNLSNRLFTGTPSTLDGVNPTALTLLRPTDLPCSNHWFNELGSPLPGALLLGRLTRTCAKCHPGRVRAGESTGSAASVFEFRCCVGTSTADGQQAAAFPWNGAKEEHLPPASPTTTRTTALDVVGREDRFLTSTSSELT